MRERIIHWLEVRAGLRSFGQGVLHEPIRGGPRWRYVFGAALTATFLIG